MDEIWMTTGYEGRKLFSTLLKVLAEILFTEAWNYRRLTVGTFDQEMGR